MVNFCKKCEFFLKVQFIDAEVDLCLRRIFLENKKDALAEIRSTVRFNCSRLPLKEMHFQRAIVSPEANNHDYCLYQTEREVLNGKLL